MADVGTVGVAHASVNAATRAEAHEADDDDLTPDGVAANEVIGLR